MPDSANSSARRCPMTVSWNPKAFRSIAALAPPHAGSAAWRHGSGWADAAAISSYSARKVCGAPMSWRCPPPARSTPTSISTKRLYLSSRGAARRKSGRKARRSGMCFEWQKGSLFSIPLNTCHRFINAGSSPALLYCGTTAPNMMNVLDNVDFIFNCPYAVHRPFFRRR